MPLFFACALTRQRHDFGWILPMALAFVVTPQLTGCGSPKGESEAQPTQTVGAPDAHVPLVLACQVQDKLWLPGEAFTCPDTCNQCECTEQGLRSLTADTCTSVSLPENCETTSGPRAIGERWTCVDGCNTCECVSGGVVATTLSACDAPHACEGNFHVRASAELEVLATCSEILGNLYVFADLDLAPLSQLERVHGILSLYNDGAPGFSSLNGLRGLRSVGALWLTDVLVPDLGDLAELRSVGRDESEALAGLEITGAPNLVDLSGLAGLARLDGLYLRDLPSLLSLEGANFPERVGRVSLSDLPALESIESLAEIRQLQSLSVVNCASLSNLEAGNGSLLEDVWLESNGSLAAVPLLQETQALQSLVVRSNPDLGRLSLPALETVASQLRIESNEALEVVEAPRLRAASSFVVIHNPQLPTALVDTIAAQLDAHSRSKIGLNSGDSVSPRDPCPWPMDGECDETQLCSPGTDREDCISWIR